MLKILLFLAALTAATPPSQGSFLYVGDDDEGMAVIDASRIDRSGDRAKVVVTVALAEPEEDGSRIIQFLMEWDCRTQRVRNLEAQSFDERLRPVNGGPMPPEWTTPPEGSRFTIIRGHVCQGQDLPGAGSDYRVILDRFLARLVV